MTLTPLARRLARISRPGEMGWTVLAENVPVWPAPPAVPALHWSDGDDSYGSTQGLATLLDALSARCRSQGAVIGPESILVTNGGFDALALVVRQLKAAGARRVVCAGPVLLSVAEFFRRAGLRLVLLDWPRFADRGWLALAPGPSDVVYVNTPHNPTGACLPEPVTRALLEDQQRRAFSVIFDLVYDSFCFCGTRPASPLALIENWRNVFALNSFSKNYGAPGLRVGWLMAEPTSIRELTAAFELERIAVSTAAQLRAAALYAYGNAPLIEAVGHGRKLLVDLASAHDLRATVGDGTQVWLDLGLVDAERFADELMAREQMVITTGANYHPRHPGHIRLPTGLPTRLLEAGVRAIVRTRDQMTGEGS